MVPTNLPLPRRKMIRGWTKALVSSVLELGCTSVVLRELRPVGRLANGWEVCYDSAR